MIELTPEVLSRLCGGSPCASANSASTHGARPQESEGKQEAFKKIARLVKVRDRSCDEVRCRLIRDGIEEIDVEKAIERACACSFLDDDRFADVLIRSRLRAGKGLDGIVRELKSHGIDPESINGFPERYLEAFPTQQDSAYALLCRKPPRAKNARQAAYAKLVRAGYPASIAAEATKRWFSTFASDPH